MALNRNFDFGALDRRGFVRTAGILAAAAAFRAPGGASADGEIPAEASGNPGLFAYPQKRPLIRWTSRPPQLETPFSVFNEGPITPNDAFFARYNLADVPAIDPAAYRIRIRGAVAAPLELSLAELKALAEPAEITAVNQCSGNGRRFFAPRVGGVQFGNGAMGNARWAGVPFSKVLAAAKPTTKARQVTFRGLDRSPTRSIPDYMKALDLDHAGDGEVMLAYAMNGQDLPLLNGYPVRLVVPGFYGTYWIKHVSDIEVIDREFTGFWTRVAFRIPDNPTHSVPPGGALGPSVPIGRFAVRSFITSLGDGDRVASGRATLVRGIAFDGGSGIRSVNFSSDGGETWREAALGADLGRYSFREWTIPFAPTASGTRRLMSRAVSRSGEAQPLEAHWNPAGYMRNVVESVRIEVT